MIAISTKIGPVQIEGQPNKCPFCHNKITPNLIYGHRNDDILEVICICPNQDCKRSFIGYYSDYGSFFLFEGETTLGTVEGMDFSDTISAISDNFICIYNQAFAAEQYGLVDVCGVGYRKALEFLIKDYVILSNSEDKEKITGMNLARCIDEYVDDCKVKSVAQRAVWLGNDETHYVRIWDGRSIDDLKILIDLTLHWIEMESLTRNYSAEMSSRPSKQR